MRSAAERGGDERQGCAAEKGVRPPTTDRESLGLAGAGRDWGRAEDRETGAGVVRVRRPSRAAAPGRILPQEPVYLAGVGAWLARRRRRLFVLIYEFVLVKFVDIHPAEA